MQADHRAPVGPGSELAAFAAELRPDAIPSGVMARALDLFVDWAGSALAGRQHHVVQAIHSLAEAMGPAEGVAENAVSGRSSSPYFAAMVNAAASHVVEQDDVHNGSVFHPATVVFPAALATAQALSATGQEFLAASVAGYEVGIRVGEFLGRSHYKVFHTTGTAGTLAAAAGAGRLLRLSPSLMTHAFGSAGTQAAGLWEFLRDGADSKPLHAAHAASTGLAAAWLAKGGLKGAAAVLEGRQGLAAGMSQDADPARLTDRLGSRWALAETSFKVHASCRHTHPAADALLQAMRAHALAGDDVAAVTAHVHQAAVDVLGMVDIPASVHQAKFSMGSVLGLIAYGARADLPSFETVLDREDVARFRKKVTMVVDPEIDGAYPVRWIGKVTIQTQDGRRIACRVEEPKGDPGNSLSRDEITDKAVALAASGGAHTELEAKKLFGRLWHIADAKSMKDLFW